MVGYSIIYQCVVDYPLLSTFVCFCGYREYQRKKRIALRHSVTRAYDVLLKELATTVSSSEDDDVDIIPSTTKSGEEVVMYVVYELLFFNGNVSLTLI